EAMAKRVQCSGSQVLKCVKLPGTSAVLTRFVGLYAYKIYMVPRLVRCRGCGNPGFAVLARLPWIPASAAANESESEALHYGARSSFLLCQPTTASGTLSVEAKYGLMSRSGVPSRQSRPTTDNLLPSTPSNLTTLSAIGLGRAGERSENVPRCVA